MYLVSGNNNVYSQQQWYLLAKQIEECPSELWLRDMGTLVKNKLQRGRQIIILADMNDSVVKCNKITAWADKIGLVEVVSPRALVEIPTHQRGKKAIDGIYTSHSLQPIQAGYLPFGTIQSEHRTLWLDLHIHQVFGFKPPNNIIPKARRPQSNVPHIRNKWINLYLSFLKKHCLIER